MNSENRTTYNRPTVLSDFLLSYESRLEWAQWGFAQLSPSQKRRWNGARLPRHQ